MNLNKCFFGGNITRDIEIKSTQSGKSVAKFGIAINNKWVGQDGEKREETTFVDLEAWGKAAENIARFFSKGKPIFVEARAKMDEWQDKETGQKRSKMKFVVESFQFCGGDRKDDGKASGEIEVKPSGVGRTSRKPIAEPPAMNPDDIPF